MSINLNLPYRKDQLIDILDIIQKESNGTFDYSDLGRKHKEEIKDYLKQFNLLSAYIYYAIWVEYNDLPLFLNCSNSIAREIVKYRLGINV